jgi:hypothetical protein
MSIGFRTPGQSEQVFDAVHPNSQPRRFVAQVHPAFNCFMNQSAIYVRRSKRFSPWPTPSTNEKVPDTFSQPRVSS